MLRSDWYRVALLILICGPLFVVSCQKRPATTKSSATNTSKQSVGLGEPTSVAECVGQGFGCDNDAGDPPVCPFSEPSADFCSLYENYQCILDQMSVWNDAVRACNNSCVSCVASVDPNANAEERCSLVGVPPDGQNELIAEAVTSIGSAKAGCDAISPSPSPSSSGDACTFTPSPNVNPCGILSVLDTKTVNYQCIPGAPAADLVITTSDYVQEPQPGNPQAIEYTFRCKAEYLCAFGQTPTESCSTTLTPSCISCDPILLRGKIYEAVLSTTRGVGENSPTSAEYSQLCAQSTPATSSAGDFCGTLLTNYFNANPNPTMSKSCPYCRSTFGSPSPTPTFTNSSPSSTITQSPSPTSSPTPSSTITQSPSPTSSPTPSSTITQSPSPTSSPTPTSTITQSPSPTSSPTPTSTITQSPSPTQP